LANFMDHEGELMAWNKRDGLVGVMVTWMVAGCTIIKTPTTWTVEQDTGGTTDTSDTGGGTVSCAGQLDSLGLEYYELLDVCVSGTSASGVPPNYQLTVPSAFGEYSANQSASNWDGASFWMLETNASGVMMNDYPYDGTSWPWTFDASCADYTITTADYYIIDGYSYGWVYNVYSCTDSGFPLPSPPPLAPDGKNASAGEACTAGEANFDLGVRRVLVNDASEQTLWVSPVQVSGTGFPERAWLRELDITSWGDADNLQLVDPAAPLTNNGLDVANATQISKPTSTVTWAAGARPMSTMFAIERMPISSTTHLPTVHLKWSCPTGTTTWVPVPNHHGQAATIPSTYGHSQRIVFWIADDASHVRIAPEGRYPDYVQSALIAAPSGGKAFSVHLAAYDATFTGRLVHSGTTFELHDGKVVSGSTTVNLPTQVLTSVN